MEAVSLQKLVQLLKEVVGWLAGGQVNMADEAQLCNPVCSTSEACVVEKNWALSVDQCQLQGLAVLGASH